MQTKRPLPPEVNPFIPKAAILLYGTETEAELEDLCRVIKDEGMRNIINMTQHGSAWPIYAVNGEAIVGECVGWWVALGRLDQRSRNLQSEREGEPKKLGFDVNFVLPKGSLTKEAYETIAANLPPDCEIVTPPPTD